MVALTVTDPQTNSTINLNFPGNTIHRTSTIMYMDGLSAGYEGVKSFAISTTEVTSNILTYWLNQNSTYPVGAMKAAYGTFLTALLVEFVHDQVADSAASQYNVTWSRTHPMAVSVGDDAYQTYMTLECDHTMGMAVIGTFKNMWIFDYICSSLISPLEYAVMDNLGLSQISTTNSSVKSVLMDLIYGYLSSNESLEGFIQNGYLIIKTNGSNDGNFLVIDPETGIVRDINTVYNYCGAYCFHDELTCDTYQLAANLLGKKGLHEEINWNKLAVVEGALETICGLWTYQMAARADSGDERERKAAIGNHEMDYGEAKFMEGWYAPWTIWVPPNYDDSTIIIN